MLQKLAQLGLGTTGNQNTNIITIGLSYFKQYLLIKLAKRLSDFPMRHLFINWIVNDNCPSIRVQ